jgi:hypothetical protein
MSSDNYYMIRNHPDGGFAAVMGFASDEGHTWDEEANDYAFDKNGEWMEDPNWEPCTVDPKRHQSFKTVREAFEWATSEQSEYGVSIHREVDW